MRRAYATGTSDVSILTNVPVENTERIPRGGKHTTYNIDAVIYPRWRGVYASLQPSRGHSAGLTPGHEPRVCVSIITSNIQ